MLAGLAVLAAGGTLSCDRVVGIYVGQRDAGQRDALRADAAPEHAQDSPPGNDVRPGGESPSPPAVDAAPVPDVRGSDEPARDLPAAVDAMSPDGSGGFRDASADAEPPPAPDADREEPANERDAASPTDGASADGTGAGSPSDARATDVREPPPPAPCAPAWHDENVEARVFSVPSGGQTACSLGTGERPTLAASVDDATFRGALACGACLEVRGTFAEGMVTVRVVDRAGGNGGLLLTRAAMDQISPGGSSVRVDWRLVPCDTGERPVRYYIKDDSNSGYVGIQVRDARYPVAKVSAVGTNATLPLTLQAYNYWTSSTLGLGTVTLRITDINGQTLDDPGVVVRPRAETAGRGQFPRCR